MKNQHNLELLELLEEPVEANVIEVKSVTWNKDSHGLFDYESKNCVNAKFKFKAGDYSILRNKQTSEIITVPTDEVREKEYGQEYSLLTTVFSKKENGELNYYIGTTEKTEPIKSEDQMHTEESLTDEVVKDGVYLIVRSLKNPDKSNKGHQLEIGERIKLGRVEYSVIEMKIDQKKEVSESSRFSFLKNDTKYEDMDVEIEEGSVCKVCMEELATEDNFLFSPCKCSGSCKYIHLNCLKNWMVSKVKKQVKGGTVYYHFDKFECEICKNSLPKFIIKNGQQHELLGVERPQGNYLILEESGQNKKDMIVIKNIPEDGINLGRGHQCEIRVNDISVSRQHATIQLKNSRFTLLDKISKFGTLVKLTRNLPLDNTKKAFQIGRTVLTFMMKKERLDGNQQLTPSLLPQVLKKRSETERTHRKTSH